MGDLEHPEYFDPWLTWHWSCPSCSWQGTGNDLAREHFNELFELHCPKCDHKFTFITHPSREQTEKAAAAGIPEAIVHLAAVDIVERRQHGHPDPPIQADSTSPSPPRGSQQGPNLGTDSPANAYVVGIDPMSERLVVIEHTRVLREIAMVATLLNARTLGEVRSGSTEALRIVRETYENQCDPDEDPEFDDLVNETPFGLINWLGDDYWYLAMPLARLSCQDSAPPEVIELFGQPDVDVGLDYEPATWLRPEDADAISAQLSARGYEVICGEAADAILAGYDYTEGS